jgi:hypothetical protein
MKTKLFALVSLSSLLALFAGCVGTIDGRHQAGVPGVKDTITSRYERPVEPIFAAAKKVLADMGTLYGENTITKTLEAKIDTRTVWVRIEEADPKVSKVTVQVRTKGGGSDIDLASEVDKRIALQLR